MESVASALIGSLEVYYKTNINFYFEIFLTYLFLLLVFLRVPPKLLLRTSLTQLPPLEKMSLLGLMF